MTHIIATICASFLADAECREVSMPSHVPPQMWDAPALAVSSVFFVASVGRSYALRRVFRKQEGRR